MADNDPFKEFGGQADPGDPFAEFGGEVVKKKETSSNASKLGGVFGGLAGSGPSTSTEKTIFDKPFLERDIEKGFDNSLSNPDLHKPKDGNLLGQEYYQKRKAEHENKKATATFQVKSSPEALGEYNKKRLSEIDEKIKDNEQKKFQLRDHSNQDALSTFEAPITDEKKYKELEDEQNELREYQNKLTENVAYEAANHIVPKFLDNPQEFDAAEVGREIIKISAPKQEEYFRKVEDAGNILPGIQQSKIKRHGLEIIRAFLDQHQNHPNYPTISQNVDQQINDFDEQNFELTGSKVREMIGQVLRDEGEQAWFGFGYNEEKLRNAAAKANLSPAQQKVFESYVLPLEKRIIGTEIPTGGFTKSATNAIEKSSLGAVNTVKSIVGQRTDADRLVEEMGNYDQKYRTAERRSGWQKFVDGTGDLTGQVLQMALLSKGLGTTSKILSKPNINLFLTSYANSYDNYRKSALNDMPDSSESSRNLYSMVMASFEGLSEKIFNDQKVLGAFSKSIAPSVADIAKRVSIGELSKVAAKKEFSTLLKTGVKEFGKSLGQNFVEEGSVGFMDDVAQSIFGDKDFDIIKAGKRAVEEGFTASLHSGLVSGMAARNRVQSQRAEQSFNKAAIVDMAKNPAPYYAANEGLLFSGEITPEQAQEKTAIINAASEALKTLPEDAKQLDAPEIASYIIHKLNGDERSEGIAQGILMGTVDVNEDIEDTSSDRNLAKALDVKYVPQETTSSAEETAEVAGVSSKVEGDDVPSDSNVASPVASHTSGVGNSVGKISDAEVSDWAKKNGYNISDKEDFDTATKMATQRPNYGMGNMIFGKEERTEERKDVHTHTYEKSGKTLKWNLGIYENGKGGKRYLLYEEKYPDQIDAGAIVDKDGKVAHIRTDGDFRSIGLAQTLLKEIQKDYGKIIPSEPISKQGAKAIYRFEKTKSPTQEVKDNTVQPNTEEIQKLEQERDTEIAKIEKPNLRVKLLTAKEIANSKGDALENKAKHDEIKGRSKELMSLIDCLTKSIA